MFKWIRVSQETYDRLTELSLYMQFKLRKRITYDDVIRMLLEMHEREVKGYIGESR
jgi:hypothetical protein